MKEPITVAMEAISENYYKLGEKDEHTRILGILEESIGHNYDSKCGSKSPSRITSANMLISELENLKKLIEK